MGLDGMHVELADDLAATAAAADAKLAQLAEKSAAMWRARPGRPRRSRPVPTCPSPRVGSRTRRDLLNEAAELFEESSQPLDTARCRATRLSERSQIA